MKGTERGQLMNNRHRKKKYEEIDLPAGKYAIFFNKNYKFISIANDLILGLEFTIGSILFFFESTMTAGTWLFLIGSVQLLSRPVLKILHAFSFGKTTGGNQQERRSK